MGCGQSKIEQDEGVMRCKGRKQFMREAVNSRNAFAAAHSAYTVALKDTGAAFSDYAEGEVPEHLRASSAAVSSAVAASTSSSAGAATVPIQAPIDTLPPPPPPLPDFSPAPLQRSASMPDLPLPKPKKKAPIDAAIREEDDEEEAARRDDDDVPETAASGSAQAPPPQKTQTPLRPPTPLPDPKDMATWDFFFGSQDTIPPPNLSQPEETWPESRDLQQEKIARTPPAVPPTVDDTPKEEQPPVTPEKKVVEPPPPPPQASKPVKKLKQGNPAHHQYANSVGASDSKRGKIVAMPPASVNLLQIMRQLDDHFLKASQSAHDVSKMLEATRMHYHSNFADSRGHINHSERIMRVITWNRSFKGLAKQDDANDNFDNDESETHATILDKMLAWEKKLYDEVKAGELMKIEYQGMVAKLNKQKKRNARSEVLEKTKAAVSHLHTRYIVDMQSMDSTVSEINRLRDHQLYPKLVDLVYGMAKMWEAMSEHHRSQLKIMMDLRAFEISLIPRETSQQHHFITEQLWNMLKNWHLQFQKLMSNQKEYIKALNSWLKLNLIPIESSLKEKVSSPTRLLDPPIKDLLHAWNDQLEKLPDELARGAIYSFSEVIHTIIVLQQDELQLKRKIQDTRMELERKKRQFEDWHRKYMEKRASLSEDANPEGTETANEDPVAERKVTVDAVENRLKEEEETHRKLCKQVREKSLGSLRTHLPELFRAVSDFAYSSSEIYKNLFSITQSEKPVDG
ncbi:protein ROLLING AND ERECT LEAF 2-like [Typha latifolia]|uniref:protein ROLLING AND ERECT LEAF 2-like n=1 Tax=Typha latifolia TaxID=4733 RepID=UPI003C2FE4F8